ncbi:phosphotransferase family protein [Nocardioides dongxiaopingii]|uniref:phosphotransferase family protein n=1 Tax=Nocardioides sp. S-1144 TaxID=2582905 RepID=UPI00110F319B|nr:phosphotransferase family protein [Nocardioides sp. S-1144]QCW49609.1 phosphotransferase family protein [Nocardioides sp. S-1144]
MSPPAAALDAPRMAGLLAPWARERHGATAVVRDVAPMPGNAGLSFGFTVGHDGGAERLVVRLAPPGVRRSGNTDVLRQVPLIGALERHGVAVAPVLWSTDDPAWFGTDAVVQPYLEARPLPMHGPAGAAPLDPDVVAHHLRQAVAALVPLHAVDAAAALPGWDEPRTAASEVAFWGRLLERSPEPDWVGAGRRLGAALVAHDPGRHRVGVFHGDFQTHNVLYDASGALAAVIDWEIAGVGPVGLDLGWLSMMTDPACWHAERRAVLATEADPADLLRWYEDAGGAPLPDHDWYRALACFRYGAIAAFNLHLHRTGRRVDEVSALMGGGVPVLFERGRALLDNASA